MSQLDLLQGSCDAVAGMKKAAPIIMLAGLVLAVLLVPSRGPRYRGKTARLWLEQLAHSNLAARARAEVAVRALGTNITPLLVQQLGEIDSRVRSNVTRLLKAQELIPVPDSPAEESHRQAMRGFETLGNAAVPELVRLLDNPRQANRASWLLCQLDNSVIPALLIAITNADVEARRRTVLDLGYRRLAAPGVVPALVMRLTSDADEMMRTAAAQSLGRLPELPQAAIAALINALDYRSLTTASCAAEALGLAGSRAGEAVPALLKFRHRPGATPGVADVALARIDPAMASRVGAVLPPPSRLE